MKTSNEIFKPNRKNEAAESGKIMESTNPFQHQSPSIEQLTAQRGKRRRILKPLYTVRLF